MPDDILAVYNVLNGGGVAGWGGYRINRLIGTVVKRLRLRHKKMLFVSCNPTLTSFYFQKSLP